MNRRCARAIAISAVCLGLLALLLAGAAARADEPYARSKDYDLQNIRTHLWFDLAQRNIRGEADESIAASRDDVAQIKLDSVGLTIEAVTVDGKPAKFSTTANQLLVSLDHPAPRGERHEIFIRYEGRPKKGLYFILPDANYPRQPQEIWTQGEAEDTRNYIPIYDYPNDRMTSEMILTVPGSWLTISNGKLVSVKDEPDGTKTWDWKQSEPLSSYLISAIAGDFVEKNDQWRGLPLRYVVPRGQEYKIDASFSDTKEMLDLFSSKLDVPYPWAQYAQTFVDDFVEGGMENTSATTLTVRELVNPALESENRRGADFVESHELAHQWFGDLVTCKDWADLWLNEGFATYFEHFWTEHHNGVDDATYEFWREQSQWFREKRLYPVPIVDHNFKDSDEYAGNVYTKAGWVLKMLREKLGDADFFSGLHYYLQANRGQNVVTADLEKSIEQATSINTDKFMHQWIYRAGAPQFQVSYSYDDAAHQLKLDVSQTQKVEGLVGLFDVAHRRRDHHRHPAQDVPHRSKPGHPEFHVPRRHRPAHGPIRQGRQNPQAARLQKNARRADLSAGQSGKRSRSRRRRRSPGKRKGQFRGSPGPGRRRAARSLLGRPHRISSVAGKNRRRRSRTIRLPRAQR